MWGESYNLWEKERKEWRIIKGVGRGGDKTKCRRKGGVSYLPYTCYSRRRRGKPTGNWFQHQTWENGEISSLSKILTSLKIHQIDGKRKSVKCNCKGQKVNVITGGNKKMYKRIHFLITASVLCIIFSTFPTTTKTRRLFLSSLKSPQHRFCVYVFLCGNSRIF